MSKKSPDWSELPFELEELGSRSQDALEDYFDIDMWLDDDLGIQGYMITSRRAIETLLRCAFCNGLATVTDKIDIFRRLIDEQKNDAMALDFSTLKLEQMFISFEYCSAVSVFHYLTNSRIDTNLLDRSVAILTTILQSEKILWPSTDVYDIELFEDSLSQGLLSEILLCNYERVLQCFDSIEALKSDDSVCDHIIRACYYLAKYIYTNKDKGMLDLAEKEVGAAQKAWFRILLIEGIPGSPLYYLVLLGMARNSVVGKECTFDQILQDIRSGGDL